MFETFSAKAIAALNLAREEARRLEFAQVDTDHLLLGLLAEGNGVAARALRQLGIDLRKARVATEQLSGRGYSHAAEQVFSSECLTVFGDAREISNTVDPVLVDTQDLLLALIRQPRCKGVLVLREAGCELEELLDRLMAVRARDLEAPSPPPDPDQAVLPKRFNPRLLTDPGRLAFDRAHELARAYGHTFVGTEQLLLALLISDCFASDVLRSNGLERNEAEAVAFRMIGRGSGLVEGKQALSRRTTEALDAAWREARDRKHERVGSGHILLGLLGLDAGGALTIMDMLKINLGGIQLDVERSFDDHPREPEPRWDGAEMPLTETF